jgi:hypothetical protein
MNLTRLGICLAALATLIVTASAQTPPACGAAPPKPPETDAWAVQLPTGRWITEIPGWVAAPAPVCWVLGRVELKHDGNPPDMPLTTEPGPWVYGVDYPLGEPCPPEALGNCFWPPNSPVTPPDGPYAK